MRRMRLMRGSVTVLSPREQRQPCICLARVSTDSRGLLRVLHLHQDSEECAKTRDPAPSRTKFKFNFGAKAIAACETGTIGTAPCTLSPLARLAAAGRRAIAWC
eukprot:TRINITY_DN6361_c0_g1_i1.p3 TRINITY_DN6361_c0_g1~~TRINITY_DN6361_c0_g1_i1.p3  ORF type:complete len:104 (+),score=2.15 TRINITY_DN6361_c0_g1_i1:1343-1654(+)